MVQTIITKLLSWSDFVLTTPEKESKGCRLLVWHFFVVRAFSSPEVVNRGAAKPLLCRNRRFRFEASKSFVLYLTRCHFRQEHLYRRLVNACHPEFSETVCQVGKSSNGGNRGDSCELQAGEMTGKQGGGGAGGGAAELYKYKIRHYQCQLGGEYLQFFCGVSEKCDPGQGERRKASQVSNCIA